VNLNGLSKAELQSLEQDLVAQYHAIQAKNLNLDLTRGKPSAEQLSLSNGLEDTIKGDYNTKEGIDTRNYGGIDGTPGARAIGAELLGVPAENVIAGGNASLTLMHQVASIAYYDGLLGAASAWKHITAPKFICPVPGYDRHFSVCEHLGIEMINVDMTAAGPDMDAVEALIKADSDIVGLWCVPRFSNPTGVVYSDEVVQRIAALGKIANPNFRVFWDNAYAIHVLDENAPALANIWDATQKTGTEQSVIQFASTSKITLAGAGVAFIGATSENIQGILKALANITIGPDKVNQLRHERFFSNGYTLAEHMKKHAAIIKPRFACVLQHLETAFGDSELGKWESAQGGYFISFDAVPGTAKAIVKLASEAGVKLTPAGATYPYSKDPLDANIRIAPTVPEVEQVDLAMQVFVLCVKLASVQKALQAA